MNFLPRAIFILFSMAILPLQAEVAAPLKRAKITEISGEVKVLKESDPVDRAAVLQESIAGRDVVHTGKRSRAEMEFADQSLCRLGANTIFSFDPSTRSMAFARGVALVHIPPGKGGARIATPAATAAIQGDTLVVRATVMPDGTPATQFTALSPRGGPTDGNIVITLHNNPNVSFQLPAGHIAVVPQNATSMSQVPRAEIDVGAFTAHSPILKDLPPSARREVGMVVDRQAEAFRSGAAQRTGYAVVGNHMVKAGADGTFTETPSPKTTPPQAAAGSGGRVQPDGTVVLPDGTKISPNNMVTLADGQSFNPTTAPSLGTGPFAGGPGTQNFFPPDFRPPPGVLPVNNTASQIFNNPVTFSGHILATLSGSTFIDPAAGTISGLAAGTHYAFGGNGAFYFDQLQLNGGTINVSGPYLQLNVVNNSMVATPLTISAATSILLTPPTTGAPTVDMGARSYGSVAVNGNLTVNGNVGIYSAAGDVKMATTATQIDASGQAAGKGGGTVTLHAAGNVDVGTVSANGAASSTGSAGGGGNVSVTAGTGTATLLSGGQIAANGGSTTAGSASSGNGGTVVVVGQQVATPGAFTASAAGGTTPATGATGGSGGVVSVQSLGGNVTLVSGVSLSAVGGTSSSTVSGTGGAGGNVVVTGNAIGLPTGATMSAKGGDGLTAAGAGGTVTLIANATGTGAASPAISVVTGTGSVVLNAEGGRVPPAGVGGTVNLNVPTGGFITVNNSGSPGIPTITAQGSAASGAVKVNGATFTAPAPNTTTPINNANVTFQGFASKSP